MRSRFAAVLLLTSVLASRSTADDARGLEFFEKRVRPVLVEQCYACHSAEAATNKKLRGGLYLDSKDGILNGGDSGPALVPGKPGASLLLKTLHYATDVKMPPKGKLPASAIADVEAWIAMGAPDPRTAAVAKLKGMSIEDGRKFWSFTPVVGPTVPAVDKKQIRNEIDAFMLAKLGDKGLSFAADADPATLIRRVSFDLIGLPPTPAEVDAFAAATKKDADTAYAELIDKLLASPRFGERWGRHWLDLARYADSITLRGFVLKEAWRYRDYVIDSFNQDVPFDRFLREQIAGDLMQGGTVEDKRRRLTATTFLTLGNTNLEEQDKKVLVMDVVDEQLDVISKAILAQTITCARCHDHKFDAIPTKDYYALAGILKNTKTLTHSNVSKWLEMPLPGGAESTAAIKEHDAAMAAVQKEIADVKATVTANAKPANPNKPMVLAIKDVEGIVVDDANAKKVGNWKASTFSGAYIGEGYIHDEGKEKGEKTLTFQPEIPTTGKFDVRIAYASGNGRAASVPVTIFSADGEKTVHVDMTKSPEIDGLFHSLGQFKFEKNNQGFVIVSNEDTKGIVVVDAIVFVPVEAETDQAKPAAKVTGDAAKLKDLEAKLKKLQASGPAREMVMSVLEESKIEDCKIHIRGSVHNQGEVAPRGFLQVATAGTMKPLPAGQSGRVELAEWLAAKENPLTARVFANRAWHWLIGSGIVRTTDNFGVTGEKPSHPELLDHLAVQFMKNNWSMKSLVREIVMSRTYRQSSVADPKAVVADPENRLLSHMNRRRLDAESIRDTILTVSGQLKLDVGGRTSGEVGSDYNYKHTDLRRSAYAVIFRNSLPEIFDAFDFADPSVCNGRRNTSTVAPQALFLMNNPFVIAQAKHTAERLLNESGIDDAGRVDLAFRLTLGRGPASAEKQLAERFLTEAGGDSKSRPQAWTQLVQTLFASIDFRYVD